MLITAFTQYAFSQSQKPIPERLITIKVTQERTDVVLNKLALQAGFEFSYSPSVIDVSRPVSLNLTNRPLREALNRIFDGKVEFRERGRYLILQKKKERDSKPAAKEVFVISGYVRDENGTPIPWASVYDKESLESTISNDYGFFRIRFHGDQLPVTLYISKLNHVDTTLVLDKGTPSYQNITLLSKPKPQPVPQPSSDSLLAAAEETVMSFFKSLENPFNVQNISDTLYRKWQVSLIPFAGTNGKLSGNVINDFSFNIIGGYSLGTQKLELSGFFNLNRGDVKSAQLAGFANVSGGKVNGVQLAGFANVVRSDVQAVQAAGFANAGFGTFKGVQLSGFANSVQGNFMGVQAAGFANVVQRSLSGTQISGFCNIVADTLNGTQIGFINFASQIAGSQVGFLNVSKSATGVPVGILSYVHDGYHKVELSADEIFYLNVAIRTGVKPFHNILTSGFNPNSDSLYLWNFGYGVGTTVSLGKKADLDFDITVSQVVKGNNFDKLNLLPKLYIGTDIKLVNKVSLAFGITLNAQVTKTDYDKYPELFTYYEPNIFYNHSWELDNTNMKMWLGAKIGVRIF